MTEALFEGRMKAERQGLAGPILRQACHTDPQSRGPIASSFQTQVRTTAPGMFGFAYQFQLNTRTPFDNLYSRIPKQTEATFEPCLCDIYETVIVAVPLLW